MRCALRADRLREEGGREADGHWGRGRPARDDFGKRKEGEIHLLSLSSHLTARLESRTSEGEGAIVHKLQLSTNVHKYKYP